MWGRGFNVLIIWIRKKEKKIRDKKGALIDALLIISLKSDNIFETEYIQCYNCYV